jgi:tRNA-uridine 2-sulfurtransferase
LRVADKPDSQEVCFAPRRTHAEFVERAGGGAAGRPGVVVDENGEILARHSGVHRFTIGQRRGLGIGTGGVPRYVAEIDAESGVVRVGSNAGVIAGGLVAAGANWLAPIPSVGQRVQVKIRSRFAPQEAQIASADASGFALLAGGGLRAVTPGQAAVLYDGERVLGGGWIQRALRESADARRRTATPADRGPEVG